MAGEQYPVIGDQNNLMTAPGPGASVANTLQSILAQRRAQQQEDLINSINNRKLDLEQQQANSLDQYRQDQASTNQAYREGLIADRQAKEQDRKQQLANEQSESDYAWDQMTGDPKMDSLWGAIGANGALAKEILPRMLALRENQSKAKTGGDLITVSPTGEATDQGYWSETGPHVVHLAYPPQGGQGGAVANTPTVWQHEEPVDEDDPSQGTHMVSYVMSPNDYKKFLDNYNKAHDGDTGETLKGNRRPPKTPQAIISPQDSSKLATLRGKGVPIHYPEMWKSDFTPKPEDAQAYQQELQNVLARAQVTPDVIAAIRDLEANHPDAPIQDVLSQAQASVGQPNGFKTPAEFTQFSNLLHIIRAQ